MDSGVAIKPGDVVKLKSGGRSMTVEAVGGTTAHVCADRNGEIVQWRVSVAALTIAEPSKSFGYRDAV